MNIIDTTLNNLIRKTMIGQCDSDQHVLTLFSIVLQIKAKNILELGVCNGNTTEPLLLGAFMNNGKLTSIDIEPTHWTPPQDFALTWQFIQIDAIQFLNNCIVENKKFDVIFIDDFHKYEHVKKELELIDSLTNVNSIIFLHDLMGEWNHPNYFLPISNHYNNQVWEGGGPYRAVNELDPQKWEWSTIPVNNGLTILRKKSKVITL